MKKNIILMLICITSLSISVSASETTSSIDKHLEELNEQAMEKAENSTIVTSGAFYDTISSIYPNIEIYDYMDGDCSIDILSLPYNDVAENALAYMWICAQVIADGSFSENYNSISFSYIGSSGYIASLRVSDYLGYSDFTTSCFCTDLGDGSAEKAFLSTYNKVFYNFDLGTKSSRDLNAIAESFGISPTTKVATISCDYYWLCSSFPMSTIYQFFSDDQKVAINLRDGMSDSRESGETAWKYINGAAANYKKILLSIGPDAFTFDTVVVICFDGDSDNRLMELVMVYQDTESPWDGQVLNYFTDEFKKGATEQN